ncbi:MAG TPA: hypothetical protein VF916_04615 [Ktedonobacterales bacterium]
MIKPKRRLPSDPFAPRTHVRLKDGYFAGWPATVVGPVARGAADAICIRVHDAEGNGTEIVTTRSRLVALDEKEYAS